MTDVAKIEKEASSKEGSSSEKIQEGTNLGHVEELRKEFSIVSLIALQITLMATWEATTGVMAATLISGGAPCLFYNYIISFLGTICIAVSLGELASVWPTAGGQYHWVAHMAPENHRLFISWLTGWISIGGQLVLTASAAFAAGLQFQALMVLNYPNTYVPARWHATLFYWLVLVYAAAVNIWGSKLLPHTNNAAGLLHIVGFVVMIIIFGVMAPKHDADYVFVEFINESGWADGASWLIGLLSAVYPFLGYDAACHLSEELPNPARDVPLAMIGSIVINGLMGLVYVIILLFSLGDLTNLLESPTGFPYIQLFFNVTNSHAGATVLALFISLVAVAANSAGLTSTSRTAWAFARDDAIPYSKFFVHLTSKHRIPVRMVVCLTVLQMLLGLIYLGNSAAFNAILSMAIFGMYLSYLLPILYMLVYGRRLISSNTVVGFGPFRLGKIGGYLLNSVALVWMIIVCVFSNFPTALPVSPQSMNYCVVVLLGWVLIGLIYYVTMGRKSYQGPIMESFWSP